MNDAIYAVLVAFLAVSLLLTTVSTSVENSVIAAAYQRRVDIADQTYPTARDAILSNLAAWTQANPTTAATGSVAGTWSDGNGATASSEIAGDSSSTAGPSHIFHDGMVNANNLATNTEVQERRIAIDITVTVDDAAVPIEHRVLVRTMNVAPFVERLAEMPIGTSMNGTVNAGGDLGGCAGTGAGCDADGTVAADDSRVHTVLQCTATVGSGTCPSNSLFDISTYATSRWQNTEADKVAP